MKKSLWPRVVLISAALLAALMIAAVVLVYNGFILLNAPYARMYSVKGVDVSHYQGDIDWETLSKQDISFAFIKATEGSTYADDRFAYNFSNAKKTGIAVGAYHFFSYDSEGITQADNFIKTVTPFDGMLPPVIDLEFYGNNHKDPPDRASVEPELKAMLTALEEHYGLKPIIYATEDSYKLYLSGDYGEYDIWIRNVFTKPSMSDGRQWTFWQYTNRARLEGYEGDEQYIDVNVFNGSREEFSAYPRFESIK